MNWVWRSKIAGVETADRLGAVRPVLASLTSRLSAWNKRNRAVLVLNKVRVDYPASINVLHPVGLNVVKDRGIFYG